MVIFYGIGIYWTGILKERSQLIISQQSSFHILTISISPFDIHRLLSSIWTVCEACFSINEKIQNKRIFLEKQRNSKKIFIHVCMLATRSMKVPVLIIACHFTRVCHTVLPCSSINSLSIVTFHCKSVTHGNTLSAQVRADWRIPCRINRKTLFICSSLSFLWPNIRHHFWIRNSDRVFTRLSKCLCWTMFWPSFEIRVQG